MFWRFFLIYELDFGFGVLMYGGRNSFIEGFIGFVGVIFIFIIFRDGFVLINVFFF